MQTRRLRNREIRGPATDTTDADSEFECAHESFTRIKFIEQIQLGQCEIDTWFFSPYPGEFGRVAKLWICEYCLRYQRTAGAYARHVDKCTVRQPPGKEIYRKGSLSAYEVDGAATSGYPMSSKLYAQRLSAREAVPRPQDAAVRRGAVRVLRARRSGRGRRAPGGALLEGEAL